MGLLRLGMGQRAGDLTLSYTTPTAGPIAAPDASQGLVEAKVDSLALYLDWLREARRRARLDLGPQSLPGHERPKHWFDADRNGFGDEVPW